VNRFAASALALALLTLPSQAFSERWEQVVDWQKRVYPIHGASAEVDVRAPSGRIRLTQGAEGHIYLYGTIRSVGRETESTKVASRASGILARSDGDKVMVEIAPKDPPHGSTQIELWIEAPPHVLVRIRGRSPSIEAAHLAGPLEVQTKGGTVQVGVAGPLNLRAETQGRVSQDLGLVVSRKGRTTLAEGKFGGGGPTVSIQNGQGNVDLHAAK
jgi:hypothetical protein